MPARHARRNADRQQFDANDPAWAIEGRDKPPDQQAAEMEQHAAVDDCTERLPGQLRRMIRLRYARGDTTRTIAAAMEISEGSVRNRLVEAKDLLRRCLEAKGIL